MICTIFMLHWYPSVTIGAVKHKMSTVLHFTVHNLHETSWHYQSLSGNNWLGFTEFYPCAKITYRKNYFTVNCMFCIIFLCFSFHFDYFWSIVLVFWGLGEIRKSKMPAVLKSWPNSRVIWRHHSLLRTSKKTSLDLKSNLPFSLSQLLYFRRYGVGLDALPSPRFPAPADNKKTGLDRVKSQDKIHRTIPNKSYFSQMACCAFLLIVFW